ncbi:MAG: ABC transporter substrate-binding protein, partial [Dysosmobacter welbionis]
AMFDPQYAGNVLLINNSRDALGIALLYLGYSVNTTDEAEIQEAYQLIADAVKNGVYQGKVMDEVFQKMEGGNAAIATYYAGDSLSMLENNEDLACSARGGQQLVRGRHVRSQNLQHKEEAEAWINFMASTEATCGIWTISGTPLPTLRRWRPILPTMRDLRRAPDPALYEIMALPEVLDRCEAYLVLPAETRTLYNDLWTQLGI